MALADVLSDFRLNPHFMSSVAAWQRIAAKPARTAPFPAQLDARLARALSERGIADLYTHQLAAVAAAWRGENVVVVTPTASGKTLCFNIPVLQTLLEQSSAQALYLYPTKALAQDQLATLAELTGALGVDIPARTYDGDTPKAARPAARRGGGIVITNPDMLHTGILPHHTRWAALFENLRYVVLDELHTYRGIFGSHMANVVRRLKRIAAFYGAAPQFIMSSATIANPRELAERLIEAPVTLVDDDGAPRGEKHFILVNPPIVDANLGLRRSAVLQVKDIAGAFLAGDVQTLVFARSRLTTEVLLTYLRDEQVAKDEPTPNLQSPTPALLRGYRGGYLPDERRAIERGLRSGEVRGVVATNALELGVDIGDLAACVMTGYPGTIASTWQQAGRAGRRAGLSAAVLVASAAPLDQYIITHPRYLFERTPEHALINPDNLAILVNHIKCAAFELPFERGEALGAFEQVDEILDWLVEEGALHRSGERVHWMSTAYPAEAISLRTGTDDTVVIQDVSGGTPMVIGEIDRQSAGLLVHEGAVYLHEARSYLVERLDWEGGIAFVRQMDVDYYTDASSSVSTHVVEVFETDNSRPVERTHGEVLLTTQVTGYRKIKRYSHETLGWGEIDLPPQEMQTTAYWLTISARLAERLFAQGILQAPNDYGPNWPEQRDKARARDGYRCRTCGAPEREGRQHDVHHLRPFREYGYIPGENEHYLIANRVDNLITLCSGCHRRAEAALGGRSALGGLSNVLRNLIPLYLMCDPRDVGVVAETKSPFTRLPTVTIYDHVPGGVGFSQRLYELHVELLRAARDLMASCRCESGCPACVGPVGEVGHETKALTITLIDALLS
jgi:DEAD/DEAH box helicase domain-containing protein